MKVLAIRGATTVTSNNKEEILKKLNIQNKNKYNFIYKKRGARRLPSF